MSTANHPESDGQTERANRVMEEVLRHYVGADQTNWDRYLPLCEFAINNSWNQNESTKSTPFYLNYGRHPRVPVMADPGLEQDLFAGVLVCTVSAAHAQEATVNDILEQKLGKLLGHASCLQNCLFYLSSAVPKKPFRANTVPAAAEFARRMLSKIKLAKQALQAARSRMKSYADTSRLDVSYSPQDLVLLNCSILVFPKRKGNKLQPKWIGPFPVVSKIGPFAYKLKLPATMKIHPVFHLNLLRKWYADPARPIHPKPIVITGNEEFEVEKILGHSPKSAVDTNHRGLQYLVKWVGYGSEHNQFIPKAAATHCKAKLTEYWKVYRNPHIKGSGSASMHHRKPNLKHTVAKKGRKTGN